MRIALAALLLAVLISLSGVAYAGTTFTTSINQDGNVCIDLFAARPIHGNLGMFAYVSASKGWSQGYTGPNLQYGIFSAGYGWGVETGSASRSGGYASLDFGKVDLKYCYEDGGATGMWQKGLATYQLSDQWAVGVAKKTGPGYGVQAECKLTPDLKVRGELYEGGKSKIALVVPL